MRQRRRWTWTFSSAVLITLGALLAPIAILANWTQLELSSTDDFVATFAPLARDPQVQDYLADQTSAVIIARADIDGLTTQLVDGISAVGLPPRADAALTALGGLAAQSAKSAISTTVTRFVQSDAFATVFEKTLRVTHTQLVRTLSGHDGAVVTLSHGTVGIQLGPIVAAVKKHMLAQGLVIANAIPAVDKTVVLLKSSGLATAQTLYALVVAVGLWLPWVVLALLVGGVLLALRRGTALVVAGAAVGLVAILTVVAIDLGRIVTVAQLAALLIPAGVAEVLFGQLTEFTRHAATVVAFVAIVVALAAWLSRPAGVPARLRAAGSALFASIRTAGDRQGFSTGAFGARVDRLVRPIRWAIAAVAALLVVVVRPLGAANLITIVLVGLLALALVELLRRPTSTPLPLTESTTS